MSTRPLLIAAIALFLSTPAMAQQGDVPAREGGAEAAKPTAALHAIDAAEQAIKADTTLDKKAKAQAIRGLNAARRALGVKPQPKKKKGKQADGEAGEGDAGDGGGKGGKKRRGKGRKNRSKDAGDGGSGDAGTGNTGGGSGTGNSGTGNSGTGKSGTGNTGTGKGDSSR